MAVTRGGGDEGEGACPAPAPPPGPAQPPPGIEVPFLVSNNTKWISGIVEATSCGDIIKALLAAEGRLKGITEEQLERFVLVERWRRVERPLKKDSCLLKIWQAWGPEARDVQFILKRVSCKKVSRPRTKVKRTNSKLIKQLADLEQKHPKYAGSDSDSEVVNMQGNIQVSSGLHTLIVLFNLLATKTTNHLSTDIPSQSLIMLFKILFTTDLFSLVYDYVNLDQIFINECQNRPPPPSYSRFLCAGSAQDHHPTEGDDTDPARQPEGQGPVPQDAGQEPLLQRRPGVCLEKLLGTDPRARRGGSAVRAAGILMRIKWNMRR